MGLSVWHWLIFLSSLLLFGGAARSRRSWATSPRASRASRRAWPRTTSDGAGPSRARSIRDVIDQRSRRSRPSATRTKTG